MAGESNIWLHSLHSWLMPSSARKPRPVSDPHSRPPAAAHGPSPVCRTRAGVGAADAEPPPPQPQMVQAPEAYRPRGLAPRIWLLKASFAVISPAGPATSCADHVQQLEPKTVSHGKGPRMGSAQRREPNQDVSKANRIFTERALCARHLEPGILWGTKQMMRLPPF